MTLKSQEAIAITAKHVQKRGDIRMNKLDKNLGVVVYSVSKAKEAINKHLSSSNFELVPNEEAEGKQEARQRRSFLVVPPVP